MSYYEEGVVLVSCLYKLDSNASSADKTNNITVIFHFMFIQRRHGQFKLSAKIEARHKMEPRGQFKVDL